jgi:hypothetical protein
VVKKGRKFYKAILFFYNLMALVVTLPSSDWKKWSRSYHEQWMSGPTCESAPPEFRSQSLSLEPVCTGIYSEIMKEISGYFNIIFVLTRVSFIRQRWLIQVWFRRRFFFFNEKRFSEETVLKCRCRRTFKVEIKWKRCHTRKSVCCLPYL